MQRSDWRARRRRACILQRQQHRCCSIGHTAAPPQRTCGASPVGCHVSGDVHLDGVQGDDGSRGIDVDRRRQGTHLHGVGSETRGGSQAFGRIPRHSRDLVRHGPGQNDTKCLVQPSYPGVRSGRVDAEAGVAAAGLRIAAGLPHRLALAGGPAAAHRHDHRVAGHPPEKGWRGRSSEPGWRGMAWPNTRCGAAQASAASGTACPPLLLLPAPPPHSLGLAGRILPLALHGAGRRAGLGSAMSRPALWRLLVHAAAAPGHPCASSSSLHLHCTCIPNRSRSAPRRSRCGCTGRRWRPRWRLSRQG